MKKIFLILALLPLSLFSQDGPYLVNPNQVWSNLKWNSLLGPPPYYQLTHLIKFGNDTIIDGLPYRVVLKAEDEMGEQWMWHGFIREDPDGKVYYKYPENNPVISLLYDFNVEVGEEVTVYGHLYWYPMTLLVQSVDSVYLHDRYRKRIDLGGGIYWIEGLGSLDGVLKSSANTIGVMYELLCSHVNDELIYQNPEYEDCWIHFFTGQDELENNKMSVYPNPASDIISLDFEHSGKTTIDILNTNGQVVHSEYLNSDKRINISGLSAGIYLLKIRDQNRRLIRRFIIQ